MTTLPARSAVDGSRDIEPGIAKMPAPPPISGGHRVRTLDPGRSTAAERAWHHLSTVLLVTVFVFFAYAHLMDWRRTGEPTGLGLVFQEGLAAFLFLVRRTPRRTSVSPVDWLTALGGSWLVLACRPAGSPVLGLGALYIGLQLAGIVLVVLSLGALGRSFGIVAADRGVKTGGPYGIVRHPVYAAYLFTEAVYLLQNPSLWNVGVLVLANICQVARIQAEERVLRHDPAYVAYSDRVRYRLVPGVF